MPEFNKDRLEVERVINLVQGFGWVKTAEELTDTHVVLTIKKKRVEVVPEPDIGTV